MSSQKRAAPLPKAEPQGYILIFRFQGGLNPHIRPETIDKALSKAAGIKLALSKNCYLFSSLTMANDAIRIAANLMVTTDEFFLFPVDDCFGSFDAETEGKLRECRIASVHVPLLKPGKSNGFSD